MLLLLMVLCFSEPTSSPIKPLVILSYNIKHGQGMDQKIDLKRIARVIARQNPDLVALQEVDLHVKRSGKVDMAQQLAKELKMHHRFGKFMNYGGGEYGMAILSRFPILDTVRHVLPPGAEPRCALEVQIYVQGLDRVVSFIGVHNDWTDAMIRTAQAETLAKALGRHPNPMIMAGDFNGEPNDSSLAVFKKQAWQFLGKKGQKTFPSDNPTVEIDFIAIKNFYPVRIEYEVIGEKVASDHRPVKAVLYLSDAAADSKSK